MSESTPPMTESMDVLVFSSRGWLGALRVEDVVETFRPLPVEPVTGAPAFVRGAAVVRGEPTPVVDIAALLGDRGGAEAPLPRRFVTVRAGARRVVLEVDEVLGIRTISPAELAAAPPLLGSAIAEHVEALGTLDGQLLAVLDAGRLLPEGLLRASPAAGAP